MAAGPRQGVFGHPALGLAVPLAPTTSPLLPLLAPPLLPPSAPALVAAAPPLLPSGMPPLPQNPYAMPPPPQTSWCGSSDFSPKGGRIAFALAIS
jgi:hypothetical protein